VTERTRSPLLFVDVDGVISLFGFSPDAGEVPGPFHWIDGVAHCIPPNVGERLVRLSRRFELVWATGWEEKANEYLPYILNLDCDLPCLFFEGQAVFGAAHWKLDAIDEYAGDRPAAWIDDSIDDACRRWAAAREAPTLLLQTESAVGMTEHHVDRLLAWADHLTPPPAAEAAQGPRS
jgi:hypothetical protein